MARITVEILEPQEEHLLAWEKPQVIPDLLGIAALVEINAIASAGPLLLLQGVGDRIGKAGALVAATQEVPIIGIGPSHRIAKDPDQLRIGEVAVNPLGRLRDEAIGRRLLPDGAVLRAAGKLLLIPSDAAPIVVVAIEEVKLARRHVDFPVLAHIAKQ